MIQKYLTEDDNQAIGNSILDDQYSEALQNKWSRLLEGVENQWTRRCMAQLYENEMRHIEDLKRRILTEATVASNVPDIVKFVFPVIRKIWANIIANGLFSVQPMNGPIGGIFYWDYKYATQKGTISANMNMIDNFDKYYSSEYVEAESIAAGPGTNFSGTLAWKPLKPYGMGQAGIRFTATKVSDGTTLTIQDVSGTGSLTGNTGATSTISSYTAGTYDITFSASCTGVKAYYYYDMENVSANVPQVNVNITLEAVKAISRKLKFLWSSEAADDMRAVLGIDIEPELTSGVAQEIALGIDRELIDAAYTSGTANTATFDAAVPSGRNQVDHYRNITTAIEKVSGEINRTTHRGPGNFIVIGPSVQPIFGALATHGDLMRVVTEAPMPPQGQGVGGRPAFPLPQAPTGYGIYTMGWLQNRWLVIVDPYFPSGKVLVGLKGVLFADAGVVYAPYVPLEMTAAFLDPADFSFRKGVRTRYTKKMVNSNFYGIITVTNLP